MMIMIEYALIFAFASAVALAVFWFVAKTIGSLPVVKNSPTLDDISGFINPKLAEQRSGAQEEYYRRAENLSEAVRTLADAGEKIAATKAYMQETGFSLLESKKTVEAYMDQRSQTQ